MPRINVKDKRKQQLIEANIASIAKRGLEGTTIAHVSKGAGMSRGIVNFYFTSKEKMMQETLSFLVDEVTVIWKETIAAGREHGVDSLEIAEGVLRMLMSDRICSAKRMLVWSAFFGYAGTHAAFARIIRTMDDALTAQLKKLWQEAEYEPRAAETHARQLLALIRGHWLMAAMTDNEKKPSGFIDAWVELLRGEPISEKEKSKRAAASKARKHAGDEEGDPDILDLFAV